MNPHDELCAIRRVRGLLLERDPPQERTNDEIKRWVKQLSRQYKMSIAAAYEMVEDWCLGHPPEGKDNWEPDL